ncbi:DUF3859 domain-containing protein [Pararhodobacter oceanensis]|uniref:DUF3859 domain-containing protein n=1 Tax=Pararhodobacter oceanensis TaxID=2172121 RepID=A0A2T8HUI9_9RHOB|nr:DUF3859 domain-containing protein [Pararhodobacter oceanensis]PVH29084.1 DUF3859 domain-containing protein [Pararhodobacter oceanensis]
MRDAAHILAGPALVAGLGMGGAALADPAMILSEQIGEMTAGLFCAPPEGDRRPAPDTISGWIHVPEAPIQMVAEGQRAPALLGMGFGVRFTVTAPEAERIDYVITHPPIPPSGVTSQSWSDAVTTGFSETMFFQFDYADELQLGDWTLNASLDGEPLFEVGFVVEPAQALPALVDLCRGGSLLSLNPESRAARG